MDLWLDANVSEKHTASILRAEDGGSTKKTIKKIFIAVRTSNLMKFF
jgi:hypothetical protein